SLGLGRHVLAHGPAGVARGHRTIRGPLGLVRAVQQQGTPVVARTDRALPVPLEMGWALQPGPVRKRSLALVDRADRTLQGSLGLGVPRGQRGAAGIARADRTLR